MVNKDLALFIMKNEKFYNMLSDKEKQMISNLTYYNINLSIIPIYSSIHFNKEGMIDFEKIHNDTDQTKVYLYIGDKGKFKFYYYVKYFPPNLYLSEGHIVIFNDSPKFSIGNCDIK